MYQLSWNKLEAVSSVKLGQGGTLLGSVGTRHAYIKLALYLAGRSASDAQILRVGSADSRTPDAPMNPKVWRKWKSNGRRAHHESVPNFPPSTD